MPFAKPMPLDFRRGFVAGLGIRVKQQTHGGRKVIFDVGQVSGGPRLTLFLDTRDDFYFEVIDCKGNVHSVGPVPNSRLLEQQVALACQIKPLEEKLYLLSIYLNDQELVREKVELEAEGQGEAEYPGEIGADILGQHPAAFGMAVFLVFSKAFDATEMERMQLYILSKWEAPTHVEFSNQQTKVANSGGEGGR